MSDIYAIAKDLLWFCKKSNDTKQRSGVQEALAAGSAGGFLHKAVSKVNDALPDSNFKATVSSLSDNSSIFKTVKNTTSKCAGLTNTFMVANSLYNVATADNKTDALVEESSSLGTMVAFEKGFKALNVAKAVEEIPLPGKYQIIKPVIAAALFVGASIAGSMAGRKLGKVLTEKNDTTTANLQNTITADLSTIPLTA